MKRGLHTHCCVLVVEGEWGKREGEEDGIGRCARAGTLTCIIATHTHTHTHTHRIENSLKTLSLSGGMEKN